VIGPSGLRGGHQDTTAGGILLLLLRQKEFDLQEFSANTTVRTEPRIIRSHVGGEFPECKSLCYTVFLSVHQVFATRSMLNFPTYLARNRPEFAEQGDE
jgi:hypothetical protein